jgi:hypothetical protein
MKFDFCDGFNRRAFVKAGFTGLAGLSLPHLLRLRAEAALGAVEKDTAVIFLELAGGPTQHETYDPKPDAPAEYRGPFGTVETNVPDVRFSELMTEQAKIMDKLVILRAVHHDSGSHQTSAHLTQTGYYLRDRQSRENDMPCIGSVAARVCGANQPGLPPFVSIPNSMRYGRAAWIGKGFSPFETVKSADTKPFVVANLTLIGGMTQERLGDRRALLQGFDQARRVIDTRGVADAQDAYTRQAFEMVTGDKARVAFDIAAEPEAIRNRYGASSLGQNILLARRLVESGVKFVSVRVNTLGSWDDHKDIKGRMDAKGPAYDQGVAALITDLHERGMADRVMVVAMGEFGRTPRINKDAGRDHWGRVMSVMLAGGNLNTGQVIGSSDAVGASPASIPYRPENVLATLYQHLGIDPAMTFNDNSGRPRYLLEERGPVVT